MSSKLSFFDRVKRRLFIKLTEWYFDVLMEKIAFDLKPQYFEKLNKRLFALLYSENEPQQIYWEIFRKEFVATYDQFAANMEKNISPDAKNHFLSAMLIPIARSGFLTFERKKDLFFAAQKMGIDILPTHFYNPTPNLSEIEIESNLDVNPIELDMNIPVQMDLLQSFKKYLGELSEIPDDKPDNGGFYWNNPAFNAPDSGFYYGMIRHFQPKTILEIGAGYSTLIADKAAALNGNTTIDIIEPYPMEFLNTSIKNLGELIVNPVQKVPVERFETLEAGDILFIDSTHVSKYDSDLNFIIFTVLPAIKPGVIIHFHDIFLPYDYPIEFIFEHLIFWNENYLLGAMLMDSDKYEILIANNYLGKNHSQDVKNSFGEISVEPGGGSFWMRKTRV